MNSDDVSEIKSGIDRVASALYWIAFWLIILCFNTCNSLPKIKIDDSSKIQIIQEKGEYKNVTGSAKSSK